MVTRIVLLISAVVVLMNCGNPTGAKNSNNNGNPVSAGLNPGDSIYMGCWKGIIPPGADTSDSVCRYELTGTGSFSAQYFYTVCTTQPQLSDSEMALIKTDSLSFPRYGGYQIRGDTFKDVIVENYGLVNMSIRIDISYIKFSKTKDTVFEAATEADLLNPCKTAVQVKALSPLDSIINANGGK